MSSVICRLAKYLRLPALAGVASVWLLTTCGPAFADAWQTTINTAVPQNTSLLATFSQPSSQLPANAVLSNVQLQYNYIAYGGYQNYLTVRINKGSDPGTSGGVNLGSPPASATTGSSSSLYSATNWNGQSARDTFYVRFITANGCPSPGPTIQNVTLTLTYTVTYPDLIATRAYLWSISGFEVTSPKVGDQVHINLDWQMATQSATGPFYVNCYLDGSLFSSSQKVGTWGVGSYYHSTNEIWTVTTAGYHSVACTVDATNAITESNESNNTASNGWTVPQQFDLVHGTLDIVDVNGNAAAGYVGDAVYFRLNYGVTGIGTTPSFNIACTLDGSPFKTWTNITGVGGQGYSLTTQAYTVTAGSHTVSCDLDSSAQISESNEANNNSANGWTPPTRPDLMVSAVVSGSYLANQTVQIPVTVTKTGGNLTNGSYVEAKLFWSVSNTWDSGDSQLWVSNASTPDFPNSTLNGSGTATVNATITIPNVGNGTYYIITYVDPANWHQESNETNNIAIYAVTIGPSGQAPSLTPLYRLYNGSIKDHFYTISALERDSAASRAVPYKFNYERIEGFVSSTSWTGSVPLYRYYNATKDMHYLTTNGSDSTVAAGGFALENTYYIYPTQAEWTTPLYHSEHVTNTDHFYTTSKYEYQHSVNAWAFTDRGIVGYVATKVANNRPQGGVAGVGMAVGNFSPPSFTDIALNGVGPELSFTRYYDSFSPGTTLGQGWSFNYDSWILEDASGGIHVEWGNGSESHFDSGLVPYPGYFEKVAKVNDGINYGYDITTKHQTVYKFRRFSLGTPGPNILLITVTDRSGNSLTLSREASYGVVVSSTDATGRRFTYDYLPVSLGDGRTVQRLTKVTDTSLTPNRVINLAYDAQGNLNSVTDARGNATLYSYNGDGFLAGITYPEGNSVNLTYNLLGQVTGYNNGSIALSFDYQGGAAGTIVKTGATPLVNYVPDTQYRADNIKFPDGTNIKPTYLAGNLVNLQDNVKDRNGNLSYFTYDANGNPLTVKNALGETTTYTYDVWNNLTSVADPRNTTPATSDAYKTKFTYDATGKYLQSVRKPLGGTTNYAYYPNGLLSNVTDPTSHSVSISYDTHGNVTKINDDALATSVDSTNDNAGRRLTQTDLLRPTPQLTTWTYDNNDNVTSVQVASNPAAQFRYDKNNRLYNVVDQRGKTTVYTYNGMNLLESMKSPDLKIWQYAYDSVGKLSTVTLPDSNSVTYAYDASRRLQYVRYNGTEKLYYSYDNNGNVLSLRADNSRTTSFLYDAASRVTSMTDPFTNGIGYGYDPAGNRTSITYPGSKVVTYAFDADDRLARVKDWLGAAVTTYNYNSAGIVQSISNANGTTTSFTYDGANRLTALANRRSNSSVIADYSLVLDKMGNPTGITRNEPLAPPPSTAADMLYSYGDANQIQSAGSVSYTHDGLGNLNGASNGRSFTYDYANRLMSASVGGDTFSYLYDGFGSRISRTKNGIQTKYLLDLNAGMSNVLAETDALGAVQNYYIHGLGLLSRINSSGQRFTYHYDHLGNTVAVTDDSNNVAESYTYDEFGQALASTGGSANPFRYVGKYGVMDEGNGLLHMRARYYDTDTGRFLSRDPLGFSGGDLNLFASVGGNSIARLDPMGTAWLKYDGWLYRHTAWADDLRGSLKAIWMTAGEAVLDPGGTVYELLKQAMTLPGEELGGIIYEKFVKTGKWSDKELEQWQHVAEVTQQSAEVAFEVVSIIDSVGKLYKSGVALQDIKAQTLKNGATFGVDATKAIVDIGIFIAKSASRDEK